MTAVIFQLLGGVGMFLLAMVLLTDGLKAFAGEALRRALVQFTGTPAKAFASGALVTVLVQSSSATTVTVIGFVSAGLLTFPQAVGVVMGASLGTTGTGWMVSALGLKVSVAFYALPLVGIGAFVKLLGRGRWRSLGLALAGFGLIFIGIDTLQDAMRELSGVFNLARLPSGNFLGHLLAMAVGIVLTVVMQSSSAAVATALTALHSEAINFEQAAPLVIGAAVGTTVTGALAAIGGNVSAKRTAMAHVLFNLGTGLIAVVLLPFFFQLIFWAQQNAGLDPGAMSLAAFHTTFIALGVVIFLPAVGPFSRMIERLLPEREPNLTRHLDKTVLQTPEVALEATQRALREVAAETFLALRGSILNPGEPEDAGLAAGRLRNALDQLQEFFARIPTLRGDAPLSQVRLAQLHAIDHLTRLQARFEPPESVRRAFKDGRLKPVATLAAELLERAEAGLLGRLEKGWPAEVERQAMELDGVRRTQRPLILEQTAASASTPVEALELLDAMRWLDRLGYHTWRICNYLSRENGRGPLLVDARASAHS